MVGSAVKTMVLSRAAAKPRMHRARRMVQKVQSWRAGLRLGLEVDGREDVVGIGVEECGKLEASIASLASVSLFDCTVV